MADMQQHDDELVQPSHLWSVHSSSEGRPVIRAWAKSEAEAKRLLDEIKAGDEDADKAEYWVLQLSKGDVGELKMSGFIPADA